MMQAIMSRHPQGATSGPGLSYITNIARMPAGGSLALRELLKQLKVEILPTVYEVEVSVYT